MFAIIFVLDRVTVRFAEPPVEEGISFIRNLVRAIIFVAKSLFCVKMCVVGLKSVIDVLGIPLFQNRA